MTTNESAAQKSGKLRLVLNAPSRILGKKFVRIAFWLYVGQAAAGFCIGFTLPWLKFFDVHIGLLGQ